METFNLSAGLAGLALCSICATSNAQHVDEQVLVTGTPINTSAEKLAQSVTVLESDALDRLRSSNLGETLAGQLGVSASYFGAGSARPIIRGLAGPRVRMMSDGIDALDVSTVSADHAVSIDPLAAEQIEIFRGPTTLLYGSSAVGGVINTVTNRLPTFAPEDGLEGAIEIRGDTVADDRSLSLKFDGGSDNLAWHLDGMTRNTSDYKIPGPAELEHEPFSGFLDNSDTDTSSLAAGVSWLGDASSFGVSLSRFVSNYGLPGHHHEHEDAEQVGEHSEEDTRIDLDQQRFDLRGSFIGLAGPIESINLRLGFSDYEHVELEGAETGTVFENDAYEARLELLHSPWGAWNGAFGLQVENREFSAIGEEAFVPPTDTRSIGIFMLEQRETEHWKVSLGARHESQDHQPLGALPPWDGTATSLSAAAVRSLGQSHALTMSVASAERLPSADELYSNGPHLATGNVQNGNPAIESETSQHIDIGLRRTSGDMTWTATAFATRYDDYIYLNNTGVVEDSLAVFAYAQADADFHGFEAELFTPVGNVFSGEIDLRIFADYVDGELRSGESLPRIPPRRFGVGLRFHDDRLSTGIEAVRYDAQTAVAPLEAPTGGYTMVDADLQWRMPDEGSAAWTLFFKASNLLDEDARRHTSFLKNTVPLPGKNFSFGVRAKF